MGEQNTRKPLGPIKIEKPIRNTDDFQPSKVDLIEHCESIVFYLGAIGHICSTYHLTEKKILTARRSNREMLEIRMFLCWIIKRNTTMSDLLLGRLMNVDRTSCYYLSEAFQANFILLTHAEQKYWLGIEEEIYNVVISHGKITPSVAPASKRRIPVRYVPLKYTRKYIKDNYKEIDYDYEVEQFRDYYISTGEVRSDWDASFRFWCRKSIKMDKSFSSRRGSSKSSAMAEVNDRRLREYTDRHHIQSVSSPIKSIE
tara:strand:- start:433 stop:1203 length:771 start_codon:yes stop_codon:yes gene_type:complete